ncbi:DNA repair protein RAD50 [Chionoecetes opilio]|uniref:DNA repair protein RAD50 n=1 Tax=Chionoecetes opilio TaxID=41210 RepID=A0A8J4Y5E8_CHIOP|nr:DNA repair protein RAD50 [Chionoecetes opilio]
MRPLDEGKKVKEKFDAIFSATMYIKTLDGIKKKRKEMMQDVKSMKIHLDLLRTLKDEARQKQDDLQSAKEQEKSIGEQKQQIAEEIAPMHQRLREIAKVEDDLAVIRGDLNGKKHQLKSLKQIQEELRESLTEQFACSDRELFNMIADFRKDLEQAERQQQQRTRLKYTTCPPVPAHRWLPAAHATPRVLLFLPTAGCLLPAPPRVLLFLPTAGCLLPATHHVSSCSCPPLAACCPRHHVSSCSCPPLAACCPRHTTCPPVPAYRWLPAARATPRVLLFLPTAGCLLPAPHHVSSCSCLPLAACCPRHTTCPPVPAYRSLPAARDTTCPPVPAYRSLPAARDTTCPPVPAYCSLPAARDTPRVTAMAAYTSPAVTRSTTTLQEPSNSITHEHGNTAAERHFGPPPTQNMGTLQQKDTLDHRLHRTWEHCCRKTLGTTAYLLPLLYLYPLHCPSRPELHRWTWYSNAGGVAKEIDHILVSTRWRILQNCRVYRSAEFFGTDHRLVVATLKLHVKSRRISRGNHTVFHLEKLKDLTCAHEYAVAVSNQFDVLSALGDPVELWDTFKRETLQAAKECIGERPRSRRGFVSTETLEKNLGESRCQAGWGTGTSTGLCHAGLEPS